MFSPQDSRNIIKLNSSINHELREIMDLRTCKVQNKQPNLFQFK